MLFCMESDAELLVLDQLFDKEIKELERALSKLEGKDNLED